MDTWVASLFDWTRFMPHGHCYFWTPSLVGIQAGSNATIALAYLWISGILLWLVREIRDLPFPRVYLWFAAFIFLCGVTHVMDTVVIWLPFYWIDGWIRIFTAVASVATAILITPLVPRAARVAQGMREALAHGLELETAYEQLSEVHRRTKELQKLKIQFFANVSHELRTPLTEILTHATRLDQDEALPRPRREDAGTIVRRAQDLLVRVEDLLELARLESHTARPRLEALRLRELAASILGGFQDSARRRHVRLVLAPGAESVAALADPELVRVALRNLLDNAIRFSPRRGVVTVEIGEEGGEVHVEVRDEGPGVSEDKRDEIFERYRRLHASDTPPLAGTGIGLAIVREYAEVLGGGVSVGDAPGGGALFRVTLPRAPEDAATAARGTAPPAPPEREPGAPSSPPPPRTSEARSFDEASTRVLVIEEHPETRDHVTAVLAPVARTEAVPTMGQAMESVRRAPPDVVVADTENPERDGAELVRSLQVSRELSGIPVLLLTSSHDRDQGIRLLASGARDYLVKPFSDDELRARVASLVAAKRGREALERERDALRHLGDELERTNTTLRERNAELEQFAYVASHDLQEPLHTITSFAALLHSRHREAMDPRAQKYVDCMVEGAERMRTLIDDLLAFSRASTQEFRSERIETEDLVGEVLQDLRARIQDRGARVDVGPLPAVYGDPRQLRQVFQNLISNALKFGAEEEPEVRIGAEVDDRVLRFHVTDDGIGIDPEHAEEVFGLFTRLHGPDEFAGTGIGLALVRRIVERHGGAAWLEPAEGGGTRAYFELPGDGAGLDGGAEER